MKRHLVYWFLSLAVIAATLTSCATVSPQPAAPISTSTPAVVSSSNSDSASAAPTAAVSVPTATVDANSAPAAATAPAPGGVVPASTSGAVVYTIVPANSTASFSVREQLAGHDLPNDAVGTTHSISGAVTIHADGSIDTANSKFVVDVSTLQTDQPMRDNYVRRNVLHTSQYSQAVFVPKQVDGISPDIHQTGQVAFKMTGDLTIEGVTKSVTWDVTANITSGEAVGTAVTSFTFEDFNLSQPRVPMVLSIIDKITLTIHVDLKLSGN